MALVYKLYIFANVIIEPDSVPRFTTINNYYKARVALNIFPLANSLKAEFRQWLFIILSLSLLVCSVIFITTYKLIAKNLKSKTQNTKLKAKT